MQTYFGRFQLVTCALASAVVRSFRSFWPRSQSSDLGTFGMVRKSENTSSKVASLTWKGAPLCTFGSDGRLEHLAIGFTPSTVWQGCDLKLILRVPSSRWYVIVRLSRRTGKYTAQPEQRYRAHVPASRRRLEPLLEPTSKPLGCHFLGQSSPLLGGVWERNLCSKGSSLARPARTMQRMEPRRHNCIFRHVQSSHAPASHTLLHCVTNLSSQSQIRASTCAKDDNALSKT